MVFRICSERRRPPYVLYNIKINRKWGTHGEIFLHLPSTEIKSYKRRAKTVKKNNLPRKSKEYWHLSQVPHLLFSSNLPQNCSYSHITVRETESCWLFQITQPGNGNTRQIWNRITLTSQILFPHYPRAFHDNVEGHRIILTDCNRDLKKNRRQEKTLVHITWSASNYWLMEVLILCAWVYPWVYWVAMEIVFLNVCSVQKT